MEKLEMVIGNNIQGLQASLQIKKLQNEKLKVQGKLSSGYQVNQASDDAAALSISEKMRSQIRGLNQGIDNLQTGISMTQVADGALVETHAILQRMNELSVKAANGTNTSKDRQSIQDEMDQLMNEADRIAYATNFNDEIYPLLSEIKDVKYQPGAGTINKLNDYTVSTGPGGAPLRTGAGSMSFTAIAGGALPADAGSIGNGSTGAIIKVMDGFGNEAKVMLNRDAVPPTNLSVTVNPDKSVLYQYNDGTINFEVLQTVSTYEEVDEVNLKGNTFFDVNYTFKNTGTTNLNYDFAVAVDNFAGNFNTTPYYLNGVPKTGQMKENIPGGAGNYQIVTPPVTTGGLECEIITRLGGDGIKDDADKFMMLGDMNNPSDKNVIWNDIYSSQQTTTGTGTGNYYADEVYGMWMNRSAPPGGTHTTNILQGISYKVEPSKANAVNHPKDIWIQSGPSANDGFHLPLVDATAKNLKIDKQNVLTVEGARKTMKLVENAIDIVSGFRAQFGSYHNRMEHSIRNAGNASENTQSAESSLRDADMAKEMVDYQRVNLLSQVSESIFAQVNKDKQSILKILQ